MPDLGYTITPGHLTSFGRGISGAGHGIKASNMDGLSDRGRAVWQSLYEQAAAYYSDEEHAHNCAWKGVRWLYSRNMFAGWRSRPDGERTPLLDRLPDPGNMVVLGRMIEWVCIQGLEAGAPELVVQRFEGADPPDLLWSRTQNMLVCVPKLLPATLDTMRKSVPGPLRSVAKESKGWAQRPAYGHLVAEIEAFPLQFFGLADSIAYRSDKWTKRSSSRGLRGQQEYIHQFGDDVVCLQGNGKPPSCVVFYGGAMDVEPRGIVN
jgi:hypothetical protein